MYNGIGLQTARGSGTNGYVQRNLSAVRKHAERVDYKSEEDLKKLEAQFNKKPNKDILEHDRKRQVEVKCMEMQDLMEEQGFSEEEISAKVTQFRKLLLEKAAVSDNTVLKDDYGRPIATETHQIALATEEKNARWRDAFGIEAREDEKKSFGEKMEERWEDEEEDRRREKEEEKERKKEKKKRREIEEGIRIREEERLQERKEEEERERREKKKHKKRKSRSPSPKKHHRRSRSPQSPKKHRHHDHDREHDHHDHHHDHDSPAESRRVRRRDSESPKRRHHHESPKRRHRRHSSNSPESHRSRKKR